MDSSDEESLAGLTQVPSHKRDIDGNVKVSNPYDSSSDSDGGIFNFDGNLSPEPPAKEKRKNDVFAVHDVSADLFPTPPEETGAVANALQAPINGHSNTESSVVCFFLVLFFFIFVSGIFLLEARTFTSAIASFSFISQ